MSAQTFTGEPWNIGYSAQALQDAAEHQVPYIDATTKHWLRWDIATGAYVDTGITAEGQDGEDGEVTTAQMNAAIAASENATRAMLAPVESTSTASRSYAVGDLLIYEGVLREVTAAIALGDALAVGTNLSGNSVTCSEEVFSRLAAKLDAPTSASENDILTRIGGAWVAAPPSANGGIVTLDAFYTAEGGGRQTVAALSVARCPSSTSIGEYAIFCTGVTGSGNSTSGAVDTYTSALIHGTLSDITSREFVASISIGNYAVFAGGGRYTSGMHANVDTYTAELVKGTAGSLSEARQHITPARAGNRYVIFAGGDHAGGGSPTTVVDAYTAELIKTSITALSVGTASMFGGSIGNYAVLAGGHTTSPYPSVSTAIAYDTDLVKTTITSLSQARTFGASASSDAHAVFAGGASTGSKGTPYYATVDVYAANLVRSTASNLSAAACYNAGAATSDLVLFSGGSNSAVMSAVDVFDENLVHSNLDDLSNASELLSGTSVSGRIIFAGGHNGSSYLATANAYEMSPSTAITIPAMSAYKFDGYHSEEQITLEPLAWESDGVLSGYIKLGGFTLSGKY